MTDLRERFQALDTLDVPDVMTRARRIGPKAPDPEPQIPDDASVRSCSPRSWGSSPSCSWHASSPNPRRNRRTGRRRHLLPRRRPPLPRSFAPMETSYGRRFRRTSRENSSPWIP